MGGFVLLQLGCSLYMSSCSKPLCQLSCCSVSSEAPGRAGSGVVAAYYGPFNWMRTQFIAYHCWSLKMLLSYSTAARLLSPIPLWVAFSLLYWRHGWRAKWTGGLRTWIYSCKNQNVAELASCGCCYACQRDECSWMTGWSARVKATEVDLSSQQGEVDLSIQTPSVGFLAS